MDTEVENGNAYEALRKKRRKTWLNRLLRWTWMTVVILVSVTFRIAFGIIWLMASVAGAFIIGLLSANSMDNYRRHQRAKGDYRW